ncbi:hypothetical protein O181_133175 [Austropuccinia psidii MF-1]|uniref:Uncharacterized protein n=1 Tax=Austropuccinia psidii MF-1 TaxID=1389203 RepID=A0A9Q3L491_9BASI|nr:hypothetical protein [Austropuccinia psidii MF-1]
MDTVTKDGSTWRENLPNMPFHLTFNRGLQPEYWKGMDQVLQMYQLLKSMLRWRIVRKRFNLEEKLEEVGITTQKICLRDINWVELMQRMDD